MDMDEIQVTLGKILATQELILDGFKFHLEDDRKNFSEVRERISHLEKKVNYAAGAIAVVASLITVFWNIILEKLRGA